MLRWDDNNGEGIDIDDILRDLERDDEDWIEARHEEAIAARARQDSEIRRAGADYLRSGRW